MTAEIGSSTSRDVARKPSLVGQRWIPYDDRASTELAADDFTYTGAPQVTNVSDPAYILHEQDAATALHPMIVPAETSPQGDGAAIMERDVVNHIEKALIDGASERFADGMTSEFSTKLIRLTVRYGDAAVRYLRERIASQSLSSGLTVEVTRCLGRLQDPETHGRRFQLLVRALHDGRPVVRDEAALALLDLGDPLGKKHVLEAAVREESPVLRADLLETAAQME